MAEQEPTPVLAKLTRAGLPATDRGHYFATGGLWLAKWSAALLLIAGAVWVTGWVLGEMWVVVLPVLLAIAVSTVLWPPTRWMINHGLPPAAAAGSTLLLAVAVFSGIVALIAPAIANQAPDLVDRATDGINQLRDWVQGPPINLKPDQIDGAVNALVKKMQESGSQIASGVFSGVSTAGSFVVTTVMVIVLSFFFIKDGPKFVPWLHRNSGSRAGRHFEVILVRMWDTLGGFIRTQALVSFIDAFFIGLGLLILGVPLALVLAVLTFVGGFVPFVGAFVVGALSVLVALVANGFTTALIVLVIIIAVQQLEGNVLQPILQSRSMNLHAVVVLLAVTAGGSIFGIIGAFLAVPVTAVVAVLLRYVNELIDLRISAAEQTEAAAVEADHDEFEQGAPAAPTEE